MQNSSKHLQAKRRHHHVWANYLTRWGNGTNNVYYTTSKKNIAHDSVRRIVVDDYFYKATFLESIHIKVIKFAYQHCSDEHKKINDLCLDRFLKIQEEETKYRNSGIKNPLIEKYLHAKRCNTLENLHTAHENSTLPILSALADEKLEILQDVNNMAAFMAFFGQQFCRTKTVRDKAIQNFSRQDAKHCEIAKAMEHAWWLISYILGINLSVNLFRNQHNSTHALLINKTEMPFITSDQPIINVHECVKDTNTTAPENADFYYPISPRVAYMVCDSKRFQSGKNDVDSNTVEELNTKIAAQSLVHIIGDSKNAIQPFIKFIGQRHEKFRMAKKALEQQS